MPYFTYGLVRVIEATLFYILVFFITRQLGTTIPPIGSKAFIIFVVLWPFIAAIVHPGLHSIPIIGSIFKLIDDIAQSCLGQKKEEEKEEKESLKEK